MPFGGGIRRCLADTFAQVDTRRVLPEVFAGSSCSSATSPDEPGGAPSRDHGGAPRGKGDGGPPHPRHGSRRMTLRLGSNEFYDDQLTSWFGREGYKSFVLTLLFRHGHQRTQI
jgi:hypothetical protein